MSTSIHESQRTAQKQELDKIARETLYSLAIQFRNLLKDENMLNISDVYSVLNEASQQLFQRTIAVTDSTRMLGKTNYSRPSLRALESLSKNGSIPDECSTCPRLMQCFSKRT